jgi:hypothetical protein
MDAEAKPYNQLFINAWTVISALVALAVFICFVFGAEFLATGHWIWDLLRWLASPII